MRIYLLSIVLFSNIIYGQKAPKLDGFYLKGQIGIHKINIYETEEGYFPAEHYAAIGQGDSINPHILSATIKDDLHNEIVIRLNIFESKSDTLLSSKNKHLSIGSKTMARSNERAELIIMKKYFQNEDSSRGRIYYLDGFEVRFNRSEKYYSIFCNDGIFLIENIEQNTRENKDAYILTGSYTGTLETKHHSKMVCNGLNFRIPFGVK